MNCLLKQIVYCTFAFQKQSYNKIKTNNEENNNHFYVCSTDIVGLRNNGHRCR